MTLLCTRWFEKNAYKFVATVALFVFYSSFFYGFFSYTPFSYAADTTLSGVPPTTAAPLATLGTLFLTPVERAALEAARLKRDSPQQPSSKVITKGAERLPLATSTITGLMKRSDGTITVWINGVIAPNFPGAAAQRLTSSDVGMLHNANGEKLKSTTKIR